MMKQKIQTYLRAGYSCLYAVTSEEQRVGTVLADAATELQYKVYTWSLTRGLFHDGKEVSITIGGKEVKLTDPAKLIGAFVHTTPITGSATGEHEGTFIPNKSVLLLNDWHVFLKKDKTDPVLLRAMKDAIQIGRMTQRHLIIVGCQLHLPPELEKEVTVVEFSLPGRDELKVIAESIAATNNYALNGNVERVLDAGCGLTTTEFADAVAYSLTRDKDISPDTIAGIKADTIKKNGILEVVEHKATMDDIGGLDLLKADLFSKRKAFTQAAKDYGLPTPRALLACGNPGTGKSLTATAAGSIFQIPQLRLEAGRLFEGLVGASERNWRTAFGTAKAIAPVVFWIDEVDGLFKGGGGSDGGTTARVIKAIIQDMQFNSEGIFFVFTCNDIDALPDPLVDRCDVWNVELPTRSEREAIWKIHIAKRKRKPDEFDTVDFAVKTKGFSGRQIEQAWIKAMTMAFNDDGREPKNCDVVAVLSEFVPTSVTMKDAIERRRKRLANCARPASSKGEE